MASAPPQIAGIPQQSGWKDYLTLVLSATTALAGIFYLLGWEYYGSRYGIYQSLLLTVTSSSQIALTGGLVFLMAAFATTFIVAILYYIQPSRRLLQWLTRGRLPLAAADLDGLTPAQRAIVGALDAARKLVLAYVGFVGVASGIIALLLRHSDADVAHCARCVVITTKSDSLTAEIIGKDGASLFVEDASAAIRIIKLDDVQRIEVAGTVHWAPRRPAGDA